MSLKIGIDVGSTTVKVIVLSEDNDLLYRSYERHFSMVREKTCELLRRTGKLLEGQQVRTVITGSAGLGLAKRRWKSLSPTPTPSLNWAARTPRSSSSAVPWRNG